MNISNSTETNYIMKLHLVLQPKPPPFNEVPFQGYALFLQGMDFIIQY